MRLSRTFLAASLLGTPLLSATAQTLPPGAAYQFYEVNIGGLVHDTSIAGGREGGTDINLEATTSTLVNPAWGGWAPTWLQWVLHPRFHVGVEVNTGGYTNQAYAGLTWTATIVRGVLRPQDAIEFSYLFGPSINDGDHHAQAPDHKSLGSNVLFHLGGEVAYRINSTFSVGVYFDHSSNGGFARYNGSINDIGGRIGVRF